MVIQQETPKQPEILGMLAMLDAYCASLYPSESNHLMDIDALTGDDVVFLVARDDAGMAAGCVALVRRGAYGEVKRMFVQPACRARGVGRTLLSALARRATEAGFAQLKLETGIRQPEAIALYRRDGFVECPPFGDYPPDPLSLFMEKVL